jgi:hypothetical protein
MRIAIALCLAALALSGCAQTPQSVDPPQTPKPPSLGPLAPAPAVDAARVLAEVKSFTEAYPYRQSGNAAHLGARQWLESSMKDAGLEVMRHAFDATQIGTSSAYDGENIIGIKWGEDRSRWIVIGAHYDITEGAIYGAYDDGSGTLMTIGLARAYAQVPTNRTLAFILFDQEERGLVGARAFVKAVMERTFEHNITVDAMIDLDMIGITWPHAAHIIVWETSDTLKAIILQETVDADVPANHLEFRRPVSGTSDAKAFMDAGIPTAYFWSNWDEVFLGSGHQLPGSYPWWHRADTYENMVLIAGSEATLRAGFQNVLNILSPLINTIAVGALEIDVRSD